MKKITYPKENRAERVIVTELSSHEVFPSGRYITNGHWLFHHQSLCQQSYFKAIDTVFNSLITGQPCGTYTEASFNAVENGSPVSIDRVIPTAEALSSYVPVSYSGINLEADGHKRVHTSAVYWNESRTHLFVINHSYHEFLKLYNFKLEASLEYKEMPLVIGMPASDGEITRIGVVMPMRDGAVYELLNRANPYEDKQTNEAPRQQTN